MNIPEPLTKIAHITFGFISTLASLINPALTVTSAALFVIYELDEEFKLNDEAYQEIREYLYGASAALTILILKVISA